MRFLIYSAIASFAILFSCSKTPIQPQSNGEVVLPYKILDGTSEENSFSIQPLLEFPQKVTIRYKGDFSDSKKMEIRERYTHEFQLDYVIQYENNKETWISTFVGRPKSIDEAIGELGDIETIIYDDEEDD